MDIVNRIRYFFRSDPVVHILSDSHGEALNYVNFEQFNLKPSFCIVQGATASGIANPNSKTQALPIFLKYLKTNTKKLDFILLELGEVDCGFAIWLISEKKNISVLDQTKLAVKNYIDFLNKLVSFTTNPLIIVSAILPTIEDGQDFGDIANLRKEVKANLFDRTKLTMSFNRSLKEYCAINHHVFIDLDKDLLDENTFVIKRFYKNENKLDHHLNPLKLSELLESKLKKVFDEVFN